jgi:ribosome maturation factor RimP
MVNCLDLDALTSANEWIGEAFETDPPVASAYTLEVSSPGVERPLRTDADFDRFRGEKAQVKTHAPVAGRRVFTGTIAGTEDGSVVLDCEGGRHTLPLSGLAKANLKPEIAIDDE